ncbi:MAG: DUF1501 domain-containing protein [Deltaproteobacteria bacterium]|nr:DUF1501 domain-containing protein [Deltaproteobacteria bacterium]MBK8235909.1 DUF1501 domain-containing protein [Deltaproteobacteria bacterium]MBK8713542.1 DUF1501 domain-containing protein [Deltaproteobacteria bacterium]MBP7289675.1 DUF1501 domain-containing protein [Nannocystaceae bacterium]
MITRRTFLGSAAAAAALFGGAQLGRAHAGGEDLRFLFLHVEGGWDPLTVFAPMFDAPNIDMEAAAEPWTIGGLSLVDHPARPQTRAFFEAHHGSIALLNGVSVRSVNHETCAIVALTGATSEDRPDFGTILAYERRDVTSLPHLVMSGPAFPGPYSVFVSNARGQLQETIDGSLLGNADSPIVAPSAIPGRVVDRFLRDRSEAIRLAHPSIGHTADYAEALQRAKLLVDSRFELHLQSSNSFIGRSKTAIAALSSGLCRCASVGTDFNWDTHNDNSLQSGLFENLFIDLMDVIELLDQTMGPDGKPLRETTVVVVSSEMARTPALNATGGRDHWPYTSMMLMGPGIQGDRSFGGFSELYAGVGVGSDGGLDPAQAGIAAESIGATLLMLGGVDPGDYLHTTEPVPGVLA